MGIEGLDKAQNAKESLEGKVKDAKPVAKKEHGILYRKAKLIGNVVRACFISTFTGENTYIDKESGEIIRTEEVKKYGKNGFYCSSDVKRYMELYHSLLEVTFYSPANNAVNIKLNSMRKILNAAKSMPEELQDKIIKERIGRLEESVEMAIKLNKTK